MNIKDVNSSEIIKMLNKHTCLKATLLKLDDNSPIFMIIHKHIQNTIDELCPLEKLKLMKDKDWIFFENDETKSEFKSGIKERLLQWGEHRSSIIRMYSRCLKFYKYLGSIVAKAKKEDIPDSFNAMLMKISEVFANYCEIVALKDHIEKFKPARVFLESLIGIKHSQ